MPNNSKSFQPHPQLENEIKKIDLVAHKKLQTNDVGKAIMGVTTKWDNNTKEKAFLDTGGILGKSEEVD